MEEFKSIKDDNKEILKAQEEQFSVHMCTSPSFYHIQSSQKMVKN